MFRRDSPLFVAPASHATRLTRDRTRFKGSQAAQRKCLRAFRFLGPSRLRRRRPRLALSQVIGPSRASSGARAAFVWWGLGFVWGASVVHCVAPAIRAAAASDRNYVSPTHCAGLHGPVSARSAMPRGGGCRGCRPSLTPLQHLRNLPVGLDVRGFRYRHVCGSD